jgi:hypothetical protein
MFLGEVEMNREKNDHVKEHIELSLKTRYNRKLDKDSNGARTMKPPGRKRAHKPADRRDQGEYCGCSGCPPRQNIYPALSMSHKKPALLGRICTEFRTS